MSVEWDQITGLTEDIIKQFGGKPIKRLKVVFNKTDNTADQIILNSNILQKSDKAFSCLKRIIPPGPSVEVCRRLEKLKQSPIQNFRYKNIDLSNQGIAFVSKNSGKKIVIHWNHISLLISERPITADDHYAAIKIEYMQNTAKRRLTIRGAVAYEFLEFIKLLMSRVERDVIDPDLFQIIEPHDNAINVDPAVASLIITGFLLAIAGIVILSFYPPTIASTWQKGRDCYHRFKNLPKSPIKNQPCQASGVGMRLGLI